MCLTVLEGLYFGWLGSPTNWLVPGGVHVSDHKSFWMSAWGSSHLFKNLSIWLSVPLESVSLGFCPSRSLSSQGSASLPIWGSFYLVQNLMAYEQNGSGCGPPVMLPPGFALFLVACSPLLHALLSLFNLPAPLTIPLGLFRYPNAPGLQSTQLRLGVGDGKTHESSSSSPACPTSLFFQRIACHVLTMEFADARVPFIHPISANHMKWEQWALPLKILSTLMPTCHMPICLPAQSAHSTEASELGAERCLGKHS